MSFVFFPDLITDAITDLSAQQLKDMGVSLLMMDFDNTIVPYTTSVPTDKMRSWLQMITASDIQLCVVSNSKKPRVRVFCQQYGLDCITHARKPFSDGIRRCLRKYGVAPDKAALVGDQIYTDTLGANCAGVKSILVKAINNHNFWLKARHVAEMPFIFAAKRRTCK